MFKTLIAVASIYALSAPRVEAQHIQGIDVSHWDGDIARNFVKNAGVKFAFCKATEDANFVDGKLMQNMTGASAAGVYIGPYHFAHIDASVNDPLDAVKEANYFVEAIEPFYQSPGNYLLPVVDVQNMPSLGSLADTRFYVSKWIRDFNLVVENRLGLSPIIYTSAGFAKFLLEPDLAQYPLWLDARTGLAPPNFPPPSLTGIWADWTVWQYSDTGSITGVAGAVDLDAYRGTMDELLSDLLAVPLPEPSGRLISAMMLAVVYCHQRRR